MNAIGYKSDVKSVKITAENSILYSLSVGF